MIRVTGRQWLLSGARMVGFVGGFSGPIEIPVNPTLPPFATFSRQYFPSERVKPMPPASGDAGMTYAPIVPQPSAEGDLVGMQFDGPPGIALPARLGKFAVEFVPGALGVRDNVEVFYGGTAYPAQVVILSAQPDDASRVHHALLIVQHPAWNGTTQTPAMIRKGGSGPAGSPVVLDAATAADSGITGTLVYKKRKKPARAPDDKNGGVWDPATDFWTVYDDGEEIAVNQSYDISAAAMVQNGINSSTRYGGPLATEMRFSLDLGLAVRYTVDITRYADGKFDYECELMTDLFNRPGTFDWGGYFFDWNLKLNGANVLNLVDHRSSARMGYGKIIQTAYSAALNAPFDPPEHAVQFDAGYLQWSGMAPPLRLTTGVATSRLTSNSALVKYPNFRGPWDVAGLGSPGMGGTGNRNDIAIVPEQQAVWLKTQHYNARSWVLAQAEAWRAMQVSNRDVANGWKVANPFPDTGHRALWTGTNPFEYLAPSGYTEKMPNTLPVDYMPRRDYDIGHGPLCAYLAYMITGRRMYGDLVEMQAANAINHTYNNARWRTTGGVTYDWCIMQENQPRTAGWASRDASLCQRALPDASFMKQRMMQVINYTYSYLNDRVPTWMLYQKGVTGWIAETNPYDSYFLKPFMQEHHVAGVWAAVMAGSAQAAKYMEDFAHRFPVDRISQPEGSAFTVFKSTAYAFLNGNSHDVDNPAQPLVADNYEQLAAVANASYDGYFTDGNYTQIFLRSLHLVASVIKSGTVKQKAVAGVARLHQYENAPGAYISQNTFRFDSKDDYQFLERV